MSNLSTQRSKIINKYKLDNILFRKCYFKCVLGILQYASLNVK